MNYQNTQDKASGLVEQPAINTGIAEAPSSRDEKEPCYSLLEAIARELGETRPGPPDFGYADVWKSARRMMAIEGCTQEIAYSYLRAAINGWGSAVQSKISDVDLAKIIHVAHKTPPLENEELTSKSSLVLYDAAADVIEFPVGSLDKIHPLYADPILRKGMASMISGPSKGGKSAFAKGLTLHIANGAKFLVFPTGVARKVLYIDAELQRVEITERLHELSRIYGLPIQNISYMALAAETVNRDLMQIRSQIAQISKDIGADVIVLDCLYALKPVDAEENSNDDMARVMREAGRLAVESGTAVLVVHHAGKGSKADASVMDAHAGAGGITRVVSGAVCTLREHEEPNCWSLHWQCRQRGSGTIVVRREGLGFIQEPSLNPAMMRGSRISKHADPRATRMTALEFAQRFIPADGSLGRSAILTAAVAEGVAQAVADRLLRAAIQGSHAFLHRLPLKGQEPAYGTCKPDAPLMTKAQEIRNHWITNPSSTAAEVALLFDCSDRYARELRPTSEQGDRNRGGIGVERGGPAPERNRVSAPPLKGERDPCSAVPHPDEDLFRSESETISMVSP